MASSYTEGKQQIVEYLEEIQPKTVIDVGPGCGTYWSILNGKYRSWLPGNTTFVDYTGKPPHIAAIEAFYPYLDMYQLRDKYNEIIISDARYFNWARVAADLVIFGDVLEHMTVDEAAYVFEEASLATDNIIVSLPIIPFPQGAVGGNQFEVHVKEDWTDELMKQTFGAPHKSWNGQSIGVYWFKT